ncbi:MAG: sulfite exporter TauE/SafE family protein [Anaerolineales bacterium]|nr:sulfite exporter TauE/SafE family protein [Anaerolineales bacterium]
MENIFVPRLALFFLVGFLAQIIDGALGMAYGVSANSFLLGFGLPPALASASVHTAEVFTTAISGFSHWRFGNIDKQIIKRLAFTGVIGGVIGAYLLSNIDGSAVKPWVAVYLLAMGIRILVKAFRPVNGVARAMRKQLPLLGLFGGLLDAVGGGGWGPVVTTSMLANGEPPRQTIGSVNLTEFFVTLAEAITFLLTLGLLDWPVVIGLIVGGAIAAPLGALLTKKIPTKIMLIVVGLLVIGLQIRTLVQVWF